MDKQTGDLFEQIEGFSINGGKYGFLMDIHSNLRINIILIIWKIISPEGNIIFY